MGISFEHSDPKQGHWNGYFAAQQIVRRIHIVFVERSIMRKIPHGIGVLIVGMVRRLVASKKRN